MIRAIKALFNKAFLGGEWSIAIKREEEKKYRVQNEDHKDYWLADPFLYFYDEKYYLFCEKYLRKKSKGTIGVFEINEDLSITDLGIAIEEQHHLSYPHMFEVGKDLYMIPESSGAKTIDLYICDTFPLGWKKVKTLADNIYAVDSNTFINKGQRYLITYVYQNGIPFVRVYTFDDISLTINPVCECEYSENVGRGAGNIFRKDGIAIRPTQNQRLKYGESLFFNEIKFDGYTYSECTVSEMRIENVTTDGKKQYKRIHTYNTLDDLEVVDIRSEKYELFLMVEKIRRRLYNKGR